MTDCYFSAPRVIGSLRLFSGTPIGGQLMIDWPWPFAGYIDSGDPGPDPTVAWLSFSRVVGALQLISRPGTAGAWLRVPRVIQSFRATGGNEGLPWSALGLPCPRLEGYTYTADTGLARTEMVSGAVRQRRRWSDGYKTVNTAFEVTYEQLFTLEQFIAEQGYEWFNLALITGTGDGSPEPHVVRIKSDPAYSNVYGNNIEVALVLEVKP